MRRPAEDDEDDTGEGAGEPPLKSRKTERYSFVKFMNKTNRKVEVVWINFQGALVHYRTLLPEKFFSVNTFVGHPWIFVDTETGDRMVAECREVFQPVAWNANGEDVPHRRVIDITLPVYSLHECCLQKLRSLICKDKINELDMPEVLKVELRKTFRTINYVSRHPPDT